MAEVCEVVVPCRELKPVLDWFVRELAFLIEVIFPADNPQVASISGYGVRLRLETTLEPQHPPTLRLALHSVHDEQVLVAPNGLQVHLLPADLPLNLGCFTPAFVVTQRASGSVGEGRAGMLYRDLIPNRLGGRFVASHIHIPNGGPVPDWVHFHKVQFQLIYCWHGWVKVVYEDQGPAFIMNAGDCVIQPPQIRHRVLEASSGLDVVELGCPAVHDTVADRSTLLPSEALNPNREYSGQKFVRHIGDAVQWERDEVAGCSRQFTGISSATHGLANAWVLGRVTASRVEFAPHARQLRFAFVLDGHVALEFAGAEHALEAGDSFTVPAGHSWSLFNISPEFGLLEVELLTVEQPLE
eukprot:m.20807 g.20807  ORF g.20807 m.20807 type:complete len:356 (+) comp32280_c0_seq4:189-1256(+)